MEIEIGILTAFAAMLCWGLGDFFIQKNTRKVGDVEALFFIGIIGLVGLLPFVWNDLGALLNYYNLILVVILGAITFIAALLNFEALKIGKLSVIEVIFEIELPVTILLGIVLFKEALTALQIIIISLVFISIILIAIKKEHIVHLKNPATLLEKGVLIALFGSVFMGLLNFFTAFSARKISPAMAVWAPYAVFTLFCFFIILRRKGLPKLKANWNNYKKIILSMGLFDTAAWTFYAIATSQQEVSIITAITESYPAIGVFLGLWLNKERIVSHQFIGAVVAIACSIALAFLV